MAFDSSKHPRGNPDNPGQFAVKSYDEAVGVELAATRVRRAEPVEVLALNATSYNIDNLMDEIDRGRLDCSAPYQRGSVWTEEQRAALVLSVMQRIPTSTLVVSDVAGFEDGEIARRVIDGKQRLEALRAFRNGEVSVPVDWFGEEFVDADHVETRDTADGPVDFGRIGAGLHPSAWRRVGRHVLAAVSVNVYETRNADGSWSVATRDQALGEEARIFGLINSGGTAQTEETLARAASFERR